MTKTMEPLKEALQTAGAEVRANTITGLRVDFEKGYVHDIGTAVKLKQPPAGQE